jgi:very-short-patch-repair endonuclease
MQNQPTPNAQANARTLRRGMTDSERRLWSRLRMEQLGVKFRRQHPLGNYIADFACLAPKLIVELDGSQHDEQGAYDAARDEFLRSHGFVVLRFASNAPLLNLDGVLIVIAASLVAGGPPPSQPSPEGGRSETPPRFQPSPEGGRSLKPRNSL